MKRHLLALAALALMATPALADTANVNVYGLLNVSLDNSKGTQDATTPTTATYASRWRMICNSCYLGFKGTEDLADGLKAAFQIETGVTVSAVGVTWQARNTAVGLQGGWGALSFGVWDTPYKKLGKELEPTFETGPGYMVSLLDTPGYAGASTTFAAVGGTATDVSFARRQVGSLWYVSPKFYNADLTVFYSGNGAKTPQSGSVNPSLFSTVLKYDADMFFAGFGWEMHRDARTTATFSGVSAPTNGTNDTGMKIAAGVRPLEGLMVGAEWATLKYANSLGATEDTYSKSAFLFSAGYTTSDGWSFNGAFASAGDASCTLGSGAACAQTDTGATHMTFRVGHAYSKRTDAYVFYSMMNNKTNGTYNWAIGDDRVVASVVGMDLTAFGLGVRHSF